MKNKFKWIASRKRQIAAVLFWAATVIWMIFIFSMSAKTASESSGMSGGIIQRIAPIINKDFHQLDTVGQKDFIESLQDIVRSFAHFFEFTLLGSLTCGAYCFSAKGKYKPLLLALITAWAYALTDEIHQTFVPGRAFQFKDILIDWLGVALGVALAMAVFSLIKHIIKKRSVQN